jgi:Sulfotransferase family
MTPFDARHASLAALADKTMFFIGGAPKSGTTWLQLLLDAHPGIACKGETQTVNHLAPLLMEAFSKHNQLLQQKNTTVFAELPPVPLYDRDDLAYLIAASLYLLIGKTRDPATLRAIGEKTPDNLRYFGVLREIFPAARFLHIVRDGRDCAVSGWYHVQRCTPDDWRRQKFASMRDYVDIFAREWARDLEQADAFAQQFPGSCLTIRYEDLLSDPLPALAGVFAFLGVAADDSTAAACRDAAAFARLSGGRAPGQERRDSFFRRGVAGDWWRHFGNELAASFGELAGAWLQRYGYA